MDPQIKELLTHMQKILNARNENYHMIEVLTKRNELLEELYSELHKELLELEKSVK
ncbi:hypothetical protein BR63_05740 [Thermanaerosceptrum fracticalcis]|uniref:Uncharacterized protein n=1 Tax=Thermanaerosceptrum fracticalcis TaxID=1712410 RepID=A0A7G6E1A6_THEFR|nr:hypothetical protein [Thermanaerosceptrum fracticalcis]QNB45860.1 hypothetical protein BR63_05740 [Thermanaerosceptrum fracticalcis]